uniref:RNA guanine-7 methyltransferase activating subunit n=1 Tax=Sphaeramia orbicularis TaxID=375764 RepID=A0A673BRF4_9TELE
MTETQQKLQTYEQMFAHRFSSEDHEYQQYVQRAADPPPTVDDWRGRGGGGGNQRGRDNRHSKWRHFIFHYNMLQINVNFREQFYLVQFCSVLFYLVLCYSIQFYYI